MNIKIFQINMDRDENNAAFMSLATMERMGIPFDSSIYDEAFEGEVDCADLEAVYQKFNIDHPDGYRGRSLSVSDIVEMDGKHYFCDSIGFEEIDFAPEHCRSMVNEATIRVVLLEPGKNARVADIDSSLEGMQAVVGGSIEAVYPFDEPVAIVCNV